MTSWWQKGTSMEKYVTKGHFDATIEKYVTKEHFDATIGGLRKEFVTEEHFNSTINDLRNEFTTRFDEIMTILRRLDQERIVNVESIRQIKQHLQLT
jgi:hypothetical protein